MRVFLIIVGIILVSLGAEGIRRGERGDTFIGTATLLLGAWLLYGELH